MTAARKAGPVPEADQFEALTGRGVRAVVNGRTVQVGGPALLDALGLAEPGEIAETATGWQERGGSVLWIVVDDQLAGAATLADEIRPESRAAVDALHDRGVKVVLITGDAQQVADGVAAELGIDEVFAGVLPKDKDAKVAELQARGLRVAMIDLSRASHRKMIQNLAWATGYNLVAIPVTAGVFAFAGFTLPPAAAAVAMSLSTVIEAANAQLLRRLDLRPDAVTS